MILAEILAVILAVILALAPTLTPDRRQTLTSVRVQNLSPHLQSHRCSP